MQINACSQLKPLSKYWMLDAQKEINTWTASYIFKKIRHQQLSPAIYNNLPLILNIVNLIHPIYII